MAQLSEDVFAYGKNLMSVDEALALTTERLRPLAGAETRPLALADGHVFAEDVHAAVGLPPFDNSAVDGYSSTPRVAIDSSASDAPRAAVAAIRVLETFDGSTAIAPRAAQQRPARRRRQSHSHKNSAD